MKHQKSATARAHRGYPSDVSDDEWALVAPYLTLMTEDAPQREYPLRSVFNALRWIVRAGAPWRMMPNDLPPWQTIYQQTQRCLASGVFEQIVNDLRAVLRFVEGRAEQPTAAIFDSRTLQSTPESGDRAGYDGAKRPKGSKVHMAADTLGLLLALHVSPANQQDRSQVEELARQVQKVTGESVELAYVDQGYTGERAARSSGQARHHLGSCQIGRGKARLCVAAAALGRRAEFWLAGPIPPISPRL